MSQLPEEKVCPIRPESIDDPELAAYLAQRKEAFVIDTEEKVNWYFRKLANIEAEKVRIKANHQKRLKQLEGEHIALVWRFDSDVRGFVKRLLEGSKRRSTVFLQATCGFRKNAESFKTDDKDAAAAWCKAHGLEPYYEDKTVTVLKDTKAFSLFARSYYATNDELPDGVIRTPCDENTWFYEVGPTTNTEVTAP